MPLRDLLGKAVRTLTDRRRKASGDPDRLMPMREAAQVVYDALDGTTFPMNHNLPVEARLASMATLLAARITVLGARRAGGELVEIPREEFGGGTFRDFGNAFRRHADTADTWVGLAVHERDVRATIRRLCSGG